MISLCTVVDNPQAKYFDLFKKTIVSRSNLITNVYVASIANKPRPRSIEHKEIIKGITFHYFSVHVPQQPDWISYKHSIGLHKCIDRVNTKYTLISDCDIIFIKPGFDEFYVSTFENNNLNIIGIQMYKITGWHVPFLNSYGDFPAIHNCLMETNTLPEPKMFEGKLEQGRGVACNPNEKFKVFKENYYLVLGCIPEYADLYPNPRGIYDTGCKLYLWNHFRNGNWLSFTPGWRYVKIDNWVSNLEIDIPESGLLLYHQGGIHERSDFSLFEEAYRRYFLLM